MAGLWARRCPTSRHWTTNGRIYWCARRNIKTNRRTIFIAGELGVAPLTASACRPTIFQSMEVKENYCGDRGI